MLQITLCHRDILKDGAAYHVARANLTNARPKALHDHDFPELLWVQNSKVRQVLANKKITLTEGDLLFVRPDHAHALQGVGEEAMVVSVTLHPDIVAGLGLRHPELSGQLFWSDASEPVIVKRDSRKLAELNRAALRLERAPRTALEAEAFLLPLCAELTQDVLPQTPSETPPAWLAEACLAAQDPAIFRQGAAGFVRLTGRAHPHVSRTARRYLGQSPSEFINALRMDFAARRISGTEDPLPEIAADCGIPNLSHFYKLFRAHHGETPHQFRKRFQRNLVQPA